MGKTLTNLETILSMLAPKELYQNDYCRIGNKEGDGGYVMVDDFTPRIAYSFGIGNDPSWDKDITCRGIDVYMYDHTVDYKHPRFFKRKLERSGSNTLENILIENGHDNEPDMILKMDIEGDEWEVLRRTPQHILENFSQFVVEYHYIHWALDDRYEILKEALDNVNSVFTPIHVHANNFVRMKEHEGMEFPHVIEVSYTRDHRVTENTRTFPCEYDRPNNAEKPEHDINHLFGPINTLKG